MYFVNTVFVYQQFFVLKKSIKIHTEFFYLVLSESLQLFAQLRPPVKIDIFQSAYKTTFQVTFSSSFELFFIIILV
jgi:hypothetical protein